ncbi:hypothetical protein R3P38DRAFT_972299 [Favolaschia claudopus]|uniref:Uncharacterized protein n=1 Tax=Favolaschia claudopus TaxID=2862362 RepID=A0AAW0E7F7_9AGAR
MPVFSRFSVSPSSTIGPAMRASATAPYNAWHVQALPISDKAKTMESSLSKARAASTIDSDTDGDASGGSSLGGSRSTASDATNPKEHASSHPSSSSTVPRDERRVSARASEIVDHSSHPATTLTVATAADTTEPWTFELLDEDALDAATNEIAPIGKGCGSGDLAEHKAKHAAERRFPQRSLWTPPAHFLPPLDEFWVPHSSSMTEWPTVNNIAPPKKGCGADDLATRKAKHAAERRFPQRSLWTPPAHFLPPLDEFWVPWSSLMAEWSILSSPSHSCAREDDDNDSDKENQAPVRDLGPIVPARRQASRHLTHRRVLSSLTATSNTTRNTYLDASTTVASPSVLPFALLKEKVLVSGFEGSAVDGF